MLDYPTPDEEPCFDFEVTITIKANGYVFAKNQDEAVKQILAKNWDEISVDYSTIDNVELENIRRG